MEKFAVQEWKLVQCPRDMPGETRKASTPLCHRSCPRSSPLLPAAAAPPAQTNLPNLLADLPLAFPPALPPLRPLGPLRVLICPSSSLPFHLHLPLPRLQLLRLLRLLLHPAANFTIHLFSLPLRRRHSSFVLALIPMPLRWFNCSA